MKNSNFIEIREEEQKLINGGDNITRAVFHYFGQVWAGIQAGLPHGAYGRYAGM